jgi:hypothetical protein
MNRFRKYRDAETSSSSVEELKLTGVLDAEPLLPNYPDLYPVPLSEACEGGDVDVFRLLLTYDDGVV